MQKLILLQGLPASGKSFWAKHYLKEHEDENWIIINRDSVRGMLNPIKWTSEIEELVKLTKGNIFIDALLKGFNIIVDETHLTFDKLKEYEHASGHAVDKLEISVVRFNTPFLVCLNRNRMRDERWKLSDDRMREMLESYQKEIPDGYKLIEAQYINEN